jgi:hypothetical protein
MNFKGIVILVQIIFWAPGFIANAQEKITTYSMSVLGNKEPLSFDISLSKDNTLWIDMYSAYNQETRCGFMLDEHIKPNFISTAKQAGQLYTEWKRMALENNLQEIKQKMHYIFYTGGYFSYFGNMKTDSNVRVIFAFTYFKGDYVLIINLDKMIADDDEQISFEGGTIVFNSENEIESFLNTLSTESINNLRASKSNAVDPN